MSPLKILQGNSSATSVPAARTLGVDTLPELHHACPTLPENSFHHFAPTSLQRPLTTFLSIFTVDAT